MRRRKKSRQMAFRSPDHSRWTVVTAKNQLKQQLLNFTSLIQAKEKIIQIKISRMEVKMKQKEINQDIIIKMFEKLKHKVHNANQNGLSSLLKN